MWSLDSGALLWLVVAIAAAVVEISIPHFGLIFVSFAAVVAAVTSGLGAGVVPQLALFTIALVASFVTLRPMFLKKMYGPGVPGRTEALVGRDGVVSEQIDPVRGTGRVNVGGQDWAARSVSEIEAGARITVTGADGIVLEVRRA